jgi:hypothetical protein
MYISVAYVVPKIYTTSRFLISFRNMLRFVLALAQPPGYRPPLVSCPLSLIEYIRTRLEAVSSVPNSRTDHVIVTWTTLSGTDMSIVIVEIVNVSRV